MPKAKKQPEVNFEEHAKTIAHLLEVQHRGKITTKHNRSAGTIQVTLVRKDDGKLENLRHSFETHFGPATHTDYFRYRVIPTPWGEIKIAPKDADIQHGKFRRTPTDVLIKMTKTGFSPLVAHHLKKIREQ